MSNILLCILHTTTLVIFLAILVDCLWKKLLQKGVQHLMPKKKEKKMNSKSLKKVQRIYSQHAMVLKKAASDVVKMRLSDGKNG